MSGLSSDDAIDVTSRRILLMIIKWTRHLPTFASLPMHDQVFVPFVTRDEHLCTQIRVQRRDQRKVHRAVGDGQRRRSSTILHRDCLDLCLAHSLGSILVGPVRSVDHSVFQCIG